MSYSGGGNLLAEHPPQKGAGQACAVEDGDTRVKVPDTGRAVSGVVS